MVTQQISSRDCWGRKWFGEGVEYARSQWPFGKWYEDKEIRIFRMPDVTQVSADSVRVGIESLVKKLGMDLQVKNEGIAADAIRRVKEATQGGGIDDSRLYQLSALGRRGSGKQHADVYVTNNQLLNRTCDWGGTSFYWGSIILALCEKRQKELAFVRSVARHEAGHLFGFENHHDDFAVNGYIEPRDCNMLWKCSTEETCEKCLDGMRSFWSGIDSVSGINYLKVKM